MCNKNILRMIRHDERSAPIKVNDHIDRDKTSIELKYYIEEEEKRKRISQVRDEIVEKKSN